MKLFTLFLAVSLAAQPLLSQAQEAKPASSGWIEHTYRFPSEQLVGGFATRSSGQLRAPQLPAKGASMDEAQRFLQLSHQVVTQFLESQEVRLPKGSLLAFDPATSTLFARTSREGHDEIDYLAQSLSQLVAKHLSFQLQLFEAPAPAARGVLKQAQLDASHVTAYKQIQALETSGQAKLLDSLRLESVGGQRASSSHTLDYRYGTEFILDDRAAEATAFETSPVGLRWETDSVIGPDGKTIDLTFSIKHDFAPPTPRYEPVGVVHGERYEVPATDFHRCQVQSQTTMTSGSTRLVALWRPLGEPRADAPDVLHLAFITGHVIPLMVAPSTALEPLVKTHGPQVMPAPPEPEKTTDPALPLGMIIRRFRVPPDFLAMAEGERGGAASGADPFAAAPTPASEPRMSVSMTALEILRAQGIAFPPGSSANYYRTGSELVVRNLPANMLQVETFLGSLRDKAPKTLGFTLHTVQAPGALLRQIERDTLATADHSEAWAAIEKAVAAGEAKLLNTHWIETKGGQRCTLEAVDEHVFMSELGGGSSDFTTHNNGTPKEAAEAKDKPSAHAEQTINNRVGGNDRWVYAPAFEMMPIGSRLEIVPVIGPDGWTINVTLAPDYHYAPPVLQHTPPAVQNKLHQAWSPTTSFHIAKTQSQIHLMPGKPRLLATWKPAGTPEFEGKDIRQAFFIEVSLEVVE